MKFIVCAVAAFALLVAADFVWFRFTGSFLKNEIGSIARLTAQGQWDLRFLPAFLVYALLSAGIAYFVAAHAATPAQALGMGAFFGFMTYGVYDFTNLATLSAWTWRFAAVDILWGTFLCGAVSSLAYMAGRILPS